jgi:type IX secretion system PorP/SprF family membrane protein
MNLFKYISFVSAIMFLAVACLQVVHSQEAAVYAKHYIYEQFVNPAITGRDRYPLVNISHKRSWIGTKNAPGSTCAGGSFRLGNIGFYTPSMMLNKTGFLARDRMGFGGFIMTEQNGALSQLYASGTWAYFVPFNASRTTELSFGLSAQMNHFGVKEELLDPLDAGDPALSGLDKLPYHVDGSFGVYFHTEQFHAGGSVNELFHQDSPLDDSRYYRNRMDFTFQAGYKFYLKYFDLEPSVYIARIDADPLYIYSRIKVFLRQYNWLAVSFKSTKNLAIMAGFRMGRLHIAYAYEHSITGMSSYFSGSHEIMLGLNIGLFEPEGLRKTTGKKP